MIVHDFSKHHSILNTFIAEMRDKNIQKDQMRFRRNSERIGEILGYELSKTLTYKTTETTTPLGVAQTIALNEALVLCSILRAGISLHNGLLNYFDMSENAFISAYRQARKTPEHSNIVIEYLASPDLSGKTLILADPMLATGQSLVAAYKALKPFGVPKQIHIVSVVGAEAGINYIKTHFPKNTRLWIASVDSELNEKGYIIPGLGDAGDLAFGKRL